MSAEPVPAATRRIASSDGVHVALHDLGGAGPPALLAHATGFHGRVWEPLAGALASRHCWAPDLRGHGDSVTAPGHSFAWSGFADDVLASVDALAVGGIDVSGLVGIGHSKGGAALLLAEQRRPGTFRALWCYEPVTFPPELFGEGAPAPDENPLAVGARLRRRTFPSFDAAYENYAAKPPMDVFDPAALRAYVDGGFRRTDTDEVELKCRPEDESLVYQMASGSHAFEHLGEVACPVLVVRGRTDPYSPAGIAGRVADALPAGRLEVHDDLGHFGPLEAPGAMAASIEAFLAAEAVTPPA